MELAEITQATLSVLTPILKLRLGLNFETGEIGPASLKTQGRHCRRGMTRIPQVEGVILRPVSHYEYPAREKGGSIRRRIVRRLPTVCEHQAVTVARGSKCSQTTH